MTTRHYLPLMHADPDTLIGDTHPTGLIELMSDHAISDVFESLYNEDAMHDKIVASSLVTNSKSFVTYEYTTVSGDVFYVTFFQIVS